MTHIVKPDIALPPDSDKITLTFFSFLSFVVGIPSTQVINLVGELYVTELLLVPLAFMLFFYGGASIFKVRLLKAFIIVGICMIIGYLSSDIVAGTSSSNNLRAFGRNILLLSNIIALAIMLSVDKRLIWWFILGIAVGAIINLMLSNLPITAWKFGYGRPVLLLVLLLSYFLPNRLTMLAILCVGILSIYLDSRSMGAFCLIVAGIVFLRLKNPNGLKVSLSAIFRILIIGIFVFALILAVLVQTETEHSTRRDASSAYRFSALSVGLIAVSDSPILGYGSWGEGTKKYADMYYKKLVPEMRDLDMSNALHKGNVFHPHSQVLQSWMEGGILAAAFFIFLGYQLILGLKRVIFTRQVDYFTPLYSLLLLTSLWHVFMSPYSGGHRLSIAISIAILCSLQLEKLKR